MTDREKGNIKDRDSLEFSNLRDGSNNNNSSTGISPAMSSSSNNNFSQQQQQQPVLHGSLMNSGLLADNSHREFLTAIHPSAIDYNNSSSSAEAPISSANHNNNNNINNNSNVSEKHGSAKQDYQRMLLDKLGGNRELHREKLLESLSSDNLKSVKSHAQLAKTAHGVRILAGNLNKATIKLQMRSVMIVTKARVNSLIYLTRELAEWLLLKNQEMDVYVDYHLEKSKRFDSSGLIADVPSAKPRLKYWTKEAINDNPDIFDLVITLGGDGTVLYVSTLFQRVVPPVMCFALGSLGFLTNLKFEDFRQTLDYVFKKGAKTNLRMRFTCRVHKANGELVCEQQVLNEIVIDRGPSPWVSMLELYGDGSLLTVSQADGLILATPTGSTAYSLSAGGSLVHPAVSAISVTPICPHTLSFRPILLPDSMTLKVKVPLRSRSTAWCSFDGRSRIQLQKGDYVMVVASPFPFPTIRASKTEYIDSVSRILNWNNREEQKSFVHLLSDKNKQMFNYHQTSKQEQRAASSDKKPDSKKMFVLNDDHDNNSDDENSDYSSNSIDYHQEFYGDDENYNNGNQKSENEEEYEIDYSSGDEKSGKDEEGDNSQHNRENQTASVESNGKGFSDSTYELDDTIDYTTTTNIYKPRPEDEIKTPQLEKELSLMEKCNQNLDDAKNLETAQLITGGLIDNLNKLNTDHEP